MTVNDPAWILAIAMSFLNCLLPSVDHFDIAHWQRARYVLASDIKHLDSPRNEEPAYSQKTLHLVDASTIDGTIQLYQIRLVIHSALVAARSFCTFPMMHILCPPIY